MKLEIKNKNENVLLKRTEIKAKVTFEQVTPKNDDIKKAIAKEAKCDEALTSVRHIYTDFGKREATVEAYCYQDEATMKLLENIKEKKKEEAPSQ